jgi:NhaA family Na+:H+ antiporter
MMLDDHGDGPGAEVRTPWGRSNRPLARAVVQPLQSFLQTEVSSGVVLLAAALVALLWANSPWHASYEAFWGTTLRLEAGPIVLREDLRGWVNEGLLTLFFFVVGLELKRELTTGELRDARAVALPAVAALGGMLAPAAIYLLVNAGDASSRGWAIPIATDIAFALAILNLAVRRAPRGPKAFLLTLAIVDDIGAIVVIATFYAAALEWAAIAVAAAGLGAIVALQRIQVRFTPLYVAIGVAVWAATLHSGVHATIAGVALGLLTPAIPFQRPAAVSREAHRVADETVDDPEPPDADSPQWLRLASLSREAVSPLARLEALLHPWTSFVIVPLFAVANAGVRLPAPGDIGELSAPVALGVALGLIAGKPLGIVGAVMLAGRMRLAGLPAGSSRLQVVGISLVAGIGFTVSLFIAELAFERGAALRSAKIGIICASALAGALGFVVLSRTTGGGVARGSATGSTGAATRAP